MTGKGSSILYFKYFFHSILLNLKSGVIICWIPFHIFLLGKSYGIRISHSNCGKLHSFTKWFVNEKFYFNYYLIFSCAWFHPCLNPIIYGFTGKSFRKQLTNQVRRWFRRKSHQNNETVSKISKSPGKDLQSRRDNFRKRMLIII